MGAGEFPGGSLVPQQHSGRRTLSLPRHRHWTPGEQGELRLVPGLRRKLLTDFNCSLFLSESRCSVKFAVKSSYLQCKYLLQTDWRVETWYTSVTARRSCQASHTPLRNQQNIAILCTPGQNYCTSTEGKNTAKHS